MSTSKILFSIIVFLFCWFLNISSGRAETNVEEELKALKIQFELMQKKFSTLEETVAKQQSQITVQEETKQVYEERIKDLEGQLAQKENGPVVIPSARTPASKWIPEIGVVADAVATLDSAKTDEDGSDRLSLRELELVLGSAVDPFSRLDVTISFSDIEDPSLEEAYLTRFGLPLDTTARLGKFKPKVGKVLGVHRDSLDTVDEPLVIQRYFGVEGMNKSGLDFSKTLTLPWPITQQISFGILEGGNGEEGTAFGENDAPGIRRRPTLYSHLKNYFDLNDTTGFELGFSRLIGSRDEDASFEVQVLAADTTLTHSFNANQNLKLQGEVFNLNRKESFLDVEEDDGFGNPITVRHDIDGNLWGWYGLADLRFHPQWSMGFRYDNVQLVDNPLENPERIDIGYTGYLTFYQSELARWRVQFTHKDLATGKDDNAVYLQGTFAIGEHKHKLQ